MIDMSDSRLNKVFFLTGITKPKTSGVTSESVSPSNTVSPTNLLGDTSYFVSPTIEG